MDRYTPVLAARPGELTALWHLPPDALPRVRPVLEVSATDRGPVQDAAEFFRLAQDTVPPGLRYGVDLGRLPDVRTGLRRPPLHLAEELAAYGIPMVPTIRLSDSASRLAQHAAAAGMHDGQAILRCRPLVEATGAADLDGQLDTILRRTRLAPEEIDVVIDLGEVRAARVDPDAARAAQLVALFRTRPWCSVTVASGAMPADLSRCPTDLPSAVDRADLALWRRLPGAGVGFGDFGVRSPAGRGRGRAPLPNLRYTVGARWWIYRWSRSVGTGNRAMYDLCAALVSSGHWPADGAGYSWGDAQIRRRADRTAGPGTPADWIAWATSHHLAHALRDLDRTGDTAVSRPDRAVRDTGR